MGDLPHQTDEASPAFVTDCLRDGGVLGTDSSVAEIAHEPIGVGVGIVGQLARLSLRYDGEALGAPGSVVLKLPSHLPENRAQGDHFNFYEREGRFYQHLADKLPTRTAGCYWNLVDPDANRFGLLLEDLGHCTSISQVAGVGPDRARQALVSLAGLHAELWESPAVDAFTWLPRFDGPINLSAGPGYRQAWKPFLAKFGDFLPDGSVALGARIQAGWEDLMSACRASSPVTVCHGDFRIDNLLFDDTAAPGDQVAVLDWQIVGSGPGVFDAAYLLSGSMAVDERRACEQDVVRAWHDALGRSGYRFEDAWTEYRRNLLVTTVYAVIAGAQFDLANERGRELIEGMAVRSFTACLDLDAAALA